MTPKEKRRALKSTIAEMKRRARERLNAHPLIQSRKRKRRQRMARVVAGAATVLVLLFLRCDCGDAQPVSPEAPLLAAARVPDAGPRALSKRPRPGSAIRTGAIARPEYGLGQALAPAWLDDFRMQVAARSPRLATCFRGQEKPGALRWTTALNPHSGAVSDHVFEPVIQGELSLAQRACIEGALSRPSYRIAEAYRQSVPPRVSLVIEF